jgi:hypothetical protein
MERWDYAYRLGEAEGVQAEQFGPLLKLMGDEGWELVSAVPYPPRRASGPPCVLLFFKKPKP